MKSVCIFNGSYAFYSNGNGDVNLRHIVECEKLEGGYLWDISPEQGTIKLSGTNKYLGTDTKNMRHSMRAFLKISEFQVHHTDQLWIITNEKGKLFFSPMNNPGVGLDIFDVEDASLTFWTTSRKENQEFTIVETLEEKKPDDPNEEEGSLLIYSLNAAYHNFRENYKLIVNHIKHTKYDVVCIQECNTILSNMLHSKLENEYYILQGSQVNYHHDTLMMIKRDIVVSKPDMTVVELTQNKNRNIIRSSFTLQNCKNTRIICTTAHLESKFVFDDKSGKRKSFTYKRLQLAQIGKLLKSAKKEKVLAFHVGDTNLTGHSELEIDNESVEKAGLTDLFSITDKTWNPKEDQRSTLFRNNHATWRSPDNPTIGALGHPYTEYHRPDRFFVTTSTLENLDVGKSSVKIQKMDLSDHDGIITSLTFSC